MTLIRPSLGKKKYKVLRDDGLSGGYVDGEWVESGKVEVFIKANIQPAFQAYQTRMLSEGDREKEAIWISSNQYLYTSRSGSTTPLQADYVEYNGCVWEVKSAIPYQNLGFHVEAVAVKLNESDKERVTGEVYGRV